ncbi:MAG: CCA tRNA nucleotidyltransferase [Puniceicoccaceae bacterium]
MPIRAPFPPELLAPALSLGRHVAEASGRLLIVGGAVRDALLGYTPKDLDLEVFGIPTEKLESILPRVAPFDPVGKSFSVYKLKNLPIDVSLPRLETLIGTKHTDFAVEANPHLPLEVAAQRRDFTINALSWDPLNEELIDPCHGLDDLHSRTLRHVSHKFAEDPLRVLRAAQFVSRFQLQVDPETLTLCRKLGQEGLSSERLFEEWKKLLLQGEKPSLGLRFLRDVGWLRYYPELLRLVDCPQDPEWHPEGDVWTHTLHCLDAFARSRTGDPHTDLIVGLAVLCHDLGKPATTVLSRGRLRSPGHEEAGIEPTRSFLARLTRETELLQIVPLLVSEHMKPSELFKAQASHAAVRRLALRVGRLDLLARVVNADIDGRPPIPPGDYRATEWLLHTAESLSVQAGKPIPIIQGRDVLALGLPPGPPVGRLLQACFEAQLDGVFETHADGLNYLRQLLRTASPPQQTEE